MDFLDRAMGEVVIQCFKCRICTEDAVMNLIV